MKTINFWNGSTDTRSFVTVATGLLKLKLRPYGAIQMHLLLLLLWTLYTLYCGQFVNIQVGSNTGVSPPQKKAKPSEFYWVNGHYWDVSGFFYVTGDC